MTRDDKGWTLPIKVTEPSMARDTKGLTLPSRLNSWVPKFCIMCPAGKAFCAKAPTLRSCHQGCTVLCAKIYVSWRFGFSKAGFSCFCASFTPNSFSGSSNCLKCSFADNSDIKKFSQRENHGWTKGLKSSQFTTKTPASGGRVIIISSFGGFKILESSIVVSKRGFGYKEWH